MSIQARLIGRSEADYEPFAAEHRARISAHDEAPITFDYLERDRLAADGERIFRADLSEIQGMLDGAEVEVTFRGIQAERFATTQQGEAAE